MSEQLELGITTTQDVGPGHRPAGLRYVERFITEEEERELVNHIERGPCARWLSDLNRRVQHYGYKYDYRARRIDSSMRLGAPPDWLTSISERVATTGGFAEIPDQIIVNEYQPGQGIAAHTDCEPCFGSTIATISLLSDITMSFERATGEHALRPAAATKESDSALWRGAIRMDTRDRKAEK